MHCRPGKRAVVPNGPLDYNQAMLRQKAERVFKLSSYGTTVRTEMIGGLTVFVTMAYILFVNPAVLATDFAGNPTGLDPQAVFLATALSTAFASMLMGFYANLPIAQAPGMGNNYLFVSVVMAVSALGFAQPWRVALGCVFWSGIIFLALSLFRVRKAIIDALSPSMRSGITVGIGLFITFIGLKNAGIITAKTGTLIGLNTQPDPQALAVFAVGLLAMVTAHVRRWPGSILIGIGFAAALALGLGITEAPARWVGLPEIREPAFLRFDLLGALSLQLVPYILILAFTDMFDTVGTLVGVTERAGLARDGEIPNANRALVSDATATVLGAALGTSTVTTYIESAAGVEQGGRTGLMAVFTGIFFLLSIVIAPAVGVIAGHPAVTAPALILVGLFMAAEVRRIDWSDLTESLPAFLTLLLIPLLFSIADGIALGIIAYVMVKLAASRARDVRLPMWIAAGALVLFIALVRARMG